MINAGKKPWLVVIAILDDWTPNVLYGRAALFFFVGGMSQAAPYFGEFGKSYFSDILTSTGGYSKRPFSPGITENVAAWSWIVGGLFFALRWLQTRGEKYRQVPPGKTGPVTVVSLADITRLPPAPFTAEDRRSPPRPSSYRQYDENWQVVESKEPEAPAGRPVESTAVRDDVRKAAKDVRFEMVDTFTTAAVVTTTASVASLAVATNALTAVVAQPTVPTSLKPTPVVPTPPPKPKPVMPAQVSTKPIFPPMPAAQPKPPPSLEEAMGIATALMEVTKAEAVAAAGAGNESAERLAHLRRQGSAARLAAVLINRGDAAGALALLDPFIEKYMPVQAQPASHGATMDASLPEPTRALIAIERAAKSGDAYWF